MPGKLALAKAYPFLPVAKNIIFQSFHDSVRYILLGIPLYIAFTPCRINNISLAGKGHTLYKIGNVFERSVKLDSFLANGKGFLMAMHKHIVR